MLVLLSFSYHWAGVKYDFAKYYETFHGIDCSYLVI